MQPDDGRKNKMILTPGCIEEFQKYLDGNGASKNTTRAYLADLRKLMAETGPTMTLTDSQMAAAITKWRSSDSPKTVLRRLGSLRHFARWQGETVLAHYRAPTPAFPEPHPLPEGIPGVMRMLHASDHYRARALVALCGLAGLRCHEARGVRRDDIYKLGDDWMIHVRGKGAKDRRVPLTDTAYAFIKRAHESVLSSGDTLVSMADSTAREHIARLGRVCFDRDVPSHDLRATFATAAYRASGNDLRAVQRLLGHADVKQTQTYVATTNDEMRRAAQVS